MNDRSTGPAAVPGQNTQGQDTQGFGGLLRRAAQTLHALVMPLSDPGNGMPDAAMMSLKPPQFRNLRVIGALILREMSSTYGRQPGGYVWAVLSPLGAIILLSVAFSFIVRTPALGTSFILFYATGYMPYNLYGEMAAKIAAALRYSRPLLAYPGVTWLHAMIARFVLNTLTLVTVFCIVIAGIMMIVETRSVLNIAPILVGLAMMAAVGLGVGMANCLLMGLFPVWERVWPIITRPLFLISGLFFLYEDVPPFAQDILWWNPLIHGTALVRSGFYSTYHASFASPAYGFGVAFLLIALSMLFLRRSYRTVLEQ